MDIKSKKLVLFAMRMNDAYHIDLMYTYYKMVNLEIFATVSKSFCKLSAFYNINNYVLLLHFSSLLTIDIY